MKDNATLCAHACEHREYVPKKLTKEQVKQIENLTGHTYANGVFTKEYNNILFEIFINNFGIQYIWTDSWKKRRMIDERIFKGIREILETDKGGQND